MPAAWVGIVQGPVAVDECESGTLRARVEVQQAVPAVEYVGEFVQLGTQPRGGVAVVVQVHLDVGQPAARELGQHVDALRVVLLLRVEKGVTRRAAAVVANPIHGARIVVQPAPHARQRHVARGVEPKRFEMVGDAHEHVHRSAMRLAPPRHRGARDAIDVLARHHLVRADAARGEQRRGHQTCDGADGRYHVATRKALVNRKAPPVHNKPLIQSRLSISFQRSPLSRTKMLVTAAESPTSRNSISL